MRSKLYTFIVIFITSIMAITGCSEKKDQPEKAVEIEKADNADSITEEDIDSALIVMDEIVEEDEEKTSMTLKIDGLEVPVTWEDNASVAAVCQLVPLTIEMSMYGGFEQVGSIGKSIARNDKQTTTSAGDVVLYSGNQLVIFYGSNTWSYTRLGHIDLSQEEMTDLLGKQDVVISIN